MRKIHFLDRNAISVIKSANASKQQTGDKFELLKFLRSHDKKSYIFSPLLSVFEGQSGRAESKSEVMETIRVESENMAQFFSHAKIDSNLLSEYKDEISGAIAAGIEVEFENFSNFLKFASPLIYQPLSDKVKDAHLNELVEAAPRFNLNLGHPVFICCVAIIFGNMHARKVIKPKKENFDPFNSLNDLLMITRMAHLKALTKRPDVSFHILTLDRALRSIISMMPVDGLGRSTQGSFLSSTYNAELFPDLRSDQVNELLLRLGAK